MREPASEESGGKGLIGGLLALLAAGGVAVAQVGDDLGRVIGAGARSADELGHMGAVGDDLGRTVDDLARLRPSVGSAEDGEHLSDLLGDVALEAAGQAGSLSSQDPVAVGLSSLDPQKVSDQPAMAYGGPSEQPVPQYVLVTRAQSVEGALAACVARRVWCVVQRVDAERPEDLAARFLAHRTRWETERPTDARWVASLGASLPAGAEAAWLAPDPAGGARLQIARPAGQ